MKTILFLCLSVVSIKALVLPLPLKFGGNKSPTLKSIETCPGHENDVMVVIEGTTDEEICMPGNSTINVHTRVSEDLPMDLVIKMDLQKVTPFPMTVPCLDGVGSCEYDVCAILDNANGQEGGLCDALPETQPCSCPFLKGEIEINDLEMPVQDMGDVLGAVMEGKYEAVAKFYSASTPDVSVGCVEFTFELKQC